MAGLDLGQQVGPLPLGAWVVVVGGGLGIAYYTRKSGSTPEPSIDTGGQPGVGDGSVGGWVPQAPATGTTGNVIAPQTNEEWAMRAKEHLLAMGYPATTVQSAIDKYVNGITPSVQEYTLVGIALVKVGPLPQTLPQGPAEPTPQTPVTPTPWVTPPAPAAGSGRGYGWYKIKPGDTVAKIATAVNKTQAELYAYNGYRALPVGSWYKTRFNSNPFMGYNGK